jgi:hypothetical protein
MKNWLCAVAMLAAVLAFTGCASSGDYSEGDYMGPVYPSSGMYYGSGDYYRYYDDYPEYIVTPRPPDSAPERPEHRPGLKPTHPIAYPPGERPSTLPADRASSRERSPTMSHQRARAPSIPSRSRPMGGRGGGGRRR